MRAATAVKAVALFAFALPFITGCTSTADLADGLEPAASSPATMPAPATPGSAARVAAFPEAPDERVAQPATAPAIAENTYVSSGARNTGAFPNINDEPQPSLNQMSDAEYQALKAQMEALRADHQNGRIATAQYNQRLAYLRRLAARHSPDMLARIGAN